MLGLIILAGIITITIPVTTETGHGTVSQSKFTSIRGHFDINQAKI